VFALSAVCGVVIGIVDVSEGGSLELGVFHAHTLAPCAYGIHGMTHSVVLDGDYWMKIAA
jgi:hypothetical protein